VYAVFCEKIASSSLHAVNVPCCNARLLCTRAHAYGRASMLAFGLAHARAHLGAHKAIVTSSQAAGKPSVLSPRGMFRVLLYNLATKICPNYYVVPVAVQ